MFIPDHPSPGRWERGLTMVELVISIVIISVGVLGILQVMNLTAQRSADPQVRKQALAIAEALLEEVQSMPFTQCEPDEFNVGTGACTRLEGPGAEAALAGANQPNVETRGGPIAPFDNVNDYQGPLPAGAGDIGNSTTVTIPPNYTASIAVTEDAGLGPAGQRPPQADVLRIAVTVTYGSETVLLEGYRTRYASDVMVLQ